jgi:hypothetical protein
MRQLPAIGPCYSATGHARRYDAAVSSDEPIDEPPDGAEDDAALRRARRAGGPRVNVSETVVFRAGERSIDGWALNMSEGGLRAILEESVESGQNFDVVVGDTADARPARVVWVRQEKDGAIVGVAFLDVTDGSAPPNGDETDAPEAAPAPDATPSGDE